MDITSQFIDSLAVNASAISNGKSLAKSKFQKLCISEDQSVLFGECKGSGKNPYICSVDFIDQNNPIGRCSCPSRQIPCKHALGLLYAYVDGKSFDTSDIPEDVLSKREKLEKRVENKKKIKEAKEESKTVKAPTKAKINAATKKAEAQIEGIVLAEKILNNMLNTGIASIDTQSVKTLETQAKELGNYYIGGIQNAFHEILIHIKSNPSGEYESTISSIIYLSALLKKAKAYLEIKISDPEKAIILDITTEIEEQIGYAWKLDELLIYGQFIENAQLIQLSFYNYDDEARKEYVDEGYYICLGNGKIYRTKNYRPYKAAKYIKEDDSQFGLIEVPELYIYPGGLNNRVRWNAFHISNLEKEAYIKIIAHASTDYKETVKAIKNQIKNPLSDKNPIALLKVEDLILTKTEVDGEVKEYLQIVDSSGSKQILSDEGYIRLSTAILIKSFDKELLKGAAMLVMFHNTIESGLLTAKPMSIITENEIVRLLY